MCTHFRVCVADSGEEMIFFSFECFVLLEIRARARDDYVEIGCISEN